MMRSYRAGHSRKTLFRRTLLSGALALGFAVPVLALPGASWAADQPASSAQAREWHKRHERNERLHEDLIRDVLRLTPEQQQAWQAIRAKQQAQRMARREAWSEVRHAMEQEFAKPEPDLAKVAALRDRAMQRNLQARKEIEDMRLKLYATFSAEQKAVVRDFLKMRLARGAQRFGHGREWRGARPARPGAPREQS